MSLYGDYIKERLGDGIVEDANGFATYRFIDWCGISSIYLIDLYVRPECRNARYASSLADQVVEIGKEAGCLQLIGTVTPSAKSANDSLKVLLGYGMSVLSADKDAIIFKKAI